MSIASVVVPGTRSILVGVSSVGVAGVLITLLVGTLVGHLLLVWHDWASNVDVKKRE